MRSAIFVALSCLIGVGLGSAARPQAEQRQTFATQSIARVIDVIVRDKKGKPVTGLRREAFRLSEDGVVQEILDLAEVTPASPAALAAAPFERGGSAPLRRTDTVPRLTTAIVFERLTPESREPAKVAALHLLEGNGHPDDSFGVFVLDLSLRTLEPFTTDRDRLRRAVTLASTMATSYLEDNRRGIARGGRSDPMDLSSDVDRAFQDLSRIQQGYATWNALQALATGLGRLPGRKTVLYFSDGVAAPTDAGRVRLDEAIATANRYNVAIYPVDAVGLRAHSQDMANGQALRDAALKDMNAAGSDLGGGGATYVGEYIHRSGTTSTVFNRIASGTGGFVVEDTNDLRRGTAAIDADRRFYYLLTYNPTNKDLDATWRAVTVTLPNRALTIRARSGYLAAPEKR